VTVVLAVSSLHCKLCPELLVVSNFQLLVVPIRDRAISGT
jgi:hypothetical protein